MPLLDRPDARVFYERFPATTPSERPPILLIPGLAGATRSFPWVVDRLVAHRDVVVLDPRGAGQTTSSARFRLTDIAADAAAVIDELGGQADVIGISMGGMVAQHLALRHASKIRRLTLACTTPGRSIGIRPRWMTLAGLVTGILGANERGERPLSEQLAERFGPILFAPETPMSRRIAFFRDRSAAERPTRAGLFAQLSAVSRHDAGPSLGRIVTPTLVVHGATDVLVPTANGPVLARAINGATYVELPGGHVFFFEVADRFVGAILRFFDESDPA
jgi:pimeloyl-ACP methyl ester carboxylesterase